MEGDRCDRANVGLRIQVLGGFSASVDGTPVARAGWRRRRASDLVKLLALVPGQQLHVEQAMDALWPASGSAASRQNLHNALYHARRTLDPGYARGRKSRFLVLERELLHLAGGDPAEVDADLFEAAAQNALGGDDERRLAGAAARYTGDLLPEDRYTEWTLGRRDALRALQLRVLVALARVRMEAGARDTAIAALTDAVALDPLHEPAQAELIRAYAGIGLRHQAATQLRRFTELLDRELGAEPSAATLSALETAVGVEERPALSTPAPVRRRLPVALSRFVGRREQIAEIIGSVETNRLVTLTGPGGVGKTRLALEAAQHGAKPLRDGAILVELGDLVDAQLIGQHVCDALGLAQGASRDPVELLARVLADRELLLVLDTCEHVLAEAARVAQRLLRAAPQLRMLATSRQALGIPGERVVVIPPLRLPPGDAAPEEVLRSEAVQLFLERVGRDPGALAADDRRLQAVLRICRRVDGIPLGIELAAARFRALPAEELAARLHVSLPLQPGVLTDPADRQRTLSATIDWSFRLLSQPARTTLRRLSVFVGGFTLRLAEQAFTDDALPEDELVEALVELVDKSLVLVNEQPAGTRYRLLDTVREYAQEQLDPGTEGQAIRNRHASALLGLLATADSRTLPVAAIKGGWLDAVAAEQDNVRAALEWTLEGEGDRRIGTNLVRALRWYWSERCQFAEGRRWVAAALDMPGDDQVERGNHLVTDALLAWRQGDFDEALAQATRALPTVSDGRDRWAEALAHCLLGSLHQLSGRIQDSLPATHAALELYRVLDDPYGVTWQLVVLARSWIVLGDLGKAAELAQEGLDASRDTPGAGWAEAYLGVAASARGDHTAAVEHLRAGLVLLREHDWWAADVFVAALVRAAALSGDAEVPRTAADGMVDRLSTMGSSVELAAALHAVAVLADQRGDSVAAARLIGAVDGLTDGERLEGALVDGPRYAADRARIAGSLAHDEHEALVRAGRVMSTDESTSLAKRVLAAGTVASRGT